MAGLVEMLILEGEAGFVVVVSMDDGIRLMTELAGKKVEAKEQAVELQRR